MSNDGPTPTPADKQAYDRAKKELLEALAKKRSVDKQLQTIEVQLYTLESNYLMDTSHSGGNILHGFEGYLKNPPGGRRKYEISDGDRMFSNSSVTHRKALELAGEGEESTGTMDEHHHSRMSTPGLTTVVLPPAKQELTAAQQKKHRDREYQRKKRANAARRSAQLSDDESVTSSSGRRPNKRARLADDD